MTGRIIIAAFALLAGSAAAHADVTVYRKVDCVIGKEGPNGVVCEVPPQARYHYDANGKFTGYVTYGQHKDMRARAMTRAERQARGREIANDPKRSGFAKGDAGVGEAKNRKLNDDSFPRQAIVKFQIDG